MRLYRVTITGADESVAPEALIDLSQQYTFAEWGILYSAKQEGGPRFPGRAWREQLQTACRSTNVRLSLHLCGGKLRDLLNGRNTLPVGLTEGFDRMQLNFHGEPQEMQSLSAFTTVLESMPIREYIFQIDGNMGQDIMQGVVAYGCKPEVSPLFDMSHGAGVLPTRWPEPLISRRRTINHGYAGGLGPENLAAQIPLIGAAAGDARIWIDMETKVRSANDRLFDLEKVERCLQVAAPFVTA